MWSQQLRCVSLLSFDVGPSATKERALSVQRGSDVEREEAEAAELLGPDHPTADAVDLTLVGGKVWSQQLCCFSLLSFDVRPSATKERAPSVIYSFTTQHHSNYNNNIISASLQILSGRDFKICS